MPYTPEYNPQDVPKDYLEKAKQYLCFKGAILETYEDVVNWLGLGLGGVSYGTPWGDCSVDSEGYFIWRPGNGGHANAILGYGGPEDSDGLPEYLEDLNSWGTQSLDGGWAKIRRSTFEKMKKNKNTVVVGISDMNNLKPRKISFEEHFPI